jgi:hypothetical protein
MVEKKNFLLLAIGLGIAGIVIGAISIIGSINTITNP